MRTALTLLLLLSISCGSDDSGSETDPLFGTYKITSHQRNASGCDEPGDAVDDENGFFRYAQETFFGASYVAFHECSSATECEDTIGANWFVETKDGAEWKGSSKGSGHGSLDAADDDVITCTLTVTDTVAGVSNEGIITLTKKFSTAKFEIKNKECGLESAQFELGKDSFECKTLETMTGQKQ